MLPPILGPITPYRRLCGSIFLFIAAALAPNVHYAATLMFSARAAQLTIWGMVGLYLLVIVAPPLRRVSDKASIGALVLALGLVSASTAFDRDLKRVVATCLGFYAEDAPWLIAVESATPTWAYRNSFAGYVLQIPVSWEQLPGPIEGTRELVRKEAAREGVAARLRPVCDMTDDPLPLTIERMLSQTSSVKRSCTFRHGIEACLIERRAASAPSAITPLRWEWLARDPQSNVQIRLKFELFDENMRGEALRIINSARFAETSFSASPCPNPIEWAEAAET